MKRLLNFCVITVMLLCMAGLSGCFDRRELDTMGIVLGVAIDKAEQKGLTEVTVQMANPVKSGSGGEGGEGKEGPSAFINVSESGGNINFIVRQMQRKMSRQIYVAHNQVLLLGEELAKNGVRDALDFFARAPEARMTVYVFVAQGKAKAALEVIPEFEKVPSTELAKILKDQKITSRAPIVTEFEFLSSIISKTTAAVAPIVSIVNDNETERLSVAGCGVFKDSVMVGALNEKETRGLLFVKNKVKTGVMQLDILNTPATIEIRNASSKVTPVLYTDGTAKFLVDVDMTVGIGDQSGTVNLASPEHAGAIVSAAEAEVQGEILSAVDKSKTLDADIFGFGEYLHRRYPEQWKQMEEKWGELYKKITVEVTVKAKANGNGRIDKPLVQDGA